MDRWPEPVALRVRRLLAAGIPAYAVGGVVRDALRGGASRDWDIATPALATEIAARFADAVSVDARLGAVHFDLEDGYELTFTTFRRDADYVDHRHPSRVEFVTELDADAPRRDFTCNAIYVAARDGRVFDPCGGVEDLAAGVLRCIGEPSHRFEEDVLRLLRAVRFAAQVGLAVEPGTWAAVQEKAPLLTALSAERTFAELTAMFGGPGRGRALRLLVDSGLAAVVLPEVIAMDGVPQPPEYHPEGDVLTHVCLVLDAVEPGSPVQSWCAVLHDVGKPATFERAADRIRFTGHDVLSATMADAALRRLRGPGELRETVVEVCRDHIRFASLPLMRPARRERWLRSERFPAHLAFHRADCLGSHGKLDVFAAAERWLAELPAQAPPPLCTGADVLALGVPSGRLVGVILRETQAALDELDAPDRDTALAILARCAAIHLGGGSS